MGVKTNNAKKFNPEMLRNAREAKGLTIRDLSSMLDISHQAISKYENDKAIPGADILIKLMNILEVPYEFFFKTSKNIESDKVVFFRSKANTTAKMKRIHEIKISWLIDIYEYLENIFEYPSVNLINTSNKSNFHFEPTSFKEIEELAINLRRYWGLNNGPISDITHLFEKNGIVVSVTQAEDVLVDACSKIRKKDGKLFILIGDERAAPSRIKFTLVHELGHYILHNNVRKTEFNKKDVYKRMEQEANYFASAFLMPRDSFSGELLSNSLDYYLLLKRRWNLSIQAMIYRSHELNLINEYQYSYLWKQINKKGWRKQEPEDDSLSVEKPTLFKESIDMLLNHNVKSKKLICQEIALNHMEIELLANLPKNYLADSDTSKNNIITFKR